MSNPLPPNGSPVNGAAPALDPAKISQEVYALDMLIAFARFTAGQFRFRGKLAIAEKIENLVVMVGPGQAMLLQQFREQVNTETYGKTESGLVLASNLPRG